MYISISNFVSTSDIQKNYRKIFDRVKRTKEPIVVMRGKKAEIAMIDLKTLEELQNKIAEFEFVDALKAIEQGDKELRDGKTIVTNSLADLR